MSTNQFSRRQALASTGAAFGNLALSSMLAQEGLLGAESSNPFATQATHFAPKAKQVIFLFMYGGPSHVDLFDPKPALDKWDGKEIPVFSKEDVFMSGKTKPFAKKSPFRFARHGESGIDICNQFPELSKHADKLCVIR